MGAVRRHADKDRPHPKRSRAAAETSRQPPGESAHVGRRSAGAPSHRPPSVIQKKKPTPKLHAKPKKHLLLSHRSIQTGHTGDQLCVFLIPMRVRQSTPAACNHSRALRFQGRRRTPCQVSPQLTCRFGQHRCACTRPIRVHGCNDHKRVIARLFALECIKILIFTSSICF